MLQSLKRKKLITGYSYDTDRQQYILDLNMGEKLHVDDKLVRDEKEKDFIVFLEEQVKLIEG